MLGSFQIKMESVDSDKGCRVFNTIGLSGVPGFRDETVTRNPDKNGLCEVRRRSQNAVG